MADLTPFSASPETAATHPDFVAPRLGAGSISSFAALAAAVAGTAISTPILLHALGGQTFGLWVTLTAVVSYAALLDFGFSAAVGRFVGQHRARDEVATIRTFLATAVVVYGVIFGAVVLASIAIALILPTVVRIPSGEHGLLPAVAGIGVSTALALWMTFFTNLLHAYQRLPLANGIRASYWLLQAAFLILAAVAGWGIVGLAGAMVSAAAVACGAALLAIQPIVPGFDFERLSLGQLKEVSSYSLFMFMVALGATAVFQTDNLIIASFLGAASVTAYAVALRMTRTLTLFLHKISDVLFPFYAGMRALSDRGRMRSSFLVTARLELAGAGFLVLGLAFAGTAVLRLWIGSRNVVILPVFVLAVALIVTEAIIYPAAVLAAAAAGERWMAAVNNLEAVLNLALSLFLVRRLGVAGVILGTALAQAMTNLWWLPTWALRHLRLSVWQYLVEVVRPALIAGLVGAAGGITVTATTNAIHWPGAFPAAGMALILYAISYIRWGTGLEERGWLRRLALRL